MTANTGDIFTTPQRRPIRLDKKIADGGEGSVFQVAGEPAFVAKTYHSPVEGMLAEKLLAMTRLAQSRNDLFNYSAWPKEVLIDKAHRNIVGFLMPRINHYRNIHQLYGPKDRQTYFPEADWGFLTHAAMNCSAAFAAIHAHGHVIGDVNHSNILVNKDAMVSLIDCDSMGIREGTNWFPCSEVGVVEFTAPEIQGKTLAGVTRTQNHDLFGLAVLIFHLLLLRHPFTGNLRVPSSGEIPEIGTSIAKSAFAYSRRRKTNLIPVRHWPLLDCVSPEVSDLFEQAFEAPASGTPPQRPTAITWVRALQRFEKSLKKCAKNGGHRHYNAKKDCVWCAVITSQGYDFFVTADTTLSAWSPTKAELATLLSSLKDLISISDELKLLASPFNPRLPAPLPFPQIQCPLHPGPMPEESTHPPEICERLILPATQLPLPKLVPFPDEPKFTAISAPSFPNLRPVDSLWKHLKKTNPAYPLLTAIPFLVPLLFGFQQTRTLTYILSMLAATATVIYLRMLTTRIRSENDAAQAMWQKECREIWQTYAKHVEINAGRYDAAKELWRKECHEINTTNKTKKQEYEQQHTELELERSRKQAQLDVQWETKKRLELERWRRELQVKKVNWILKKTEYDKLHAEYSKTQRLLADERESRRLLVESLTQEVEIQETFLRAQELAEIERLKKSLSLIVDSFDQKWHYLQRNYRDEVRACEDTRQQMEDFLRTQPLPRDLSGVGPVLYNSLISAGITSAADCNIQDLLDVHGIGEKKAKVILDWVAETSKAFRPPKDPAGTPKRLRINAKFGAEAARLHSELYTISSGQANELKRQRQELGRKQHALLSLREKLIQARIDYSLFT